MVIIVTGAIGVGKSTVCEKVVRIARSQGYSCGGVIAHKTDNGDIVTEDVQTGETRVLASTSAVYRGPRTVKYSFSTDGIDFGMQAVDRGLSSDILLVDELGRLELRGEGFVRVIEQIGAGKVKNCVVVIRSDLLSALLPRLGIAASVFETTADNRDRLPGEIVRLLIGGRAAG